MRGKKLHFQSTEITAFLQNLRRLSFEEQILLGAHTGTLVSCFFPWVSFDPLYGPTNFQNAFSGANWLIGAFVFGISAVIVLMFLDKLLGKNMIKYPVAENTIMGAGSLLSFVLLICAWSVLRHVGHGYAGTELRFGLALCVIAQIAAVISIWLQSQSAKKSGAEEFFQLPIEKKSRQSQSTHPKK